MLAAALFALLVPAPPSEAAVKLAVAPAAVATPALRYRLLPAVRDLAPGNPVQWYVRCFAEQRNFFYSKEGVERRVRLRAAPLAELAKAEYANFGGNALTQADYAARLDAPDWEVLRRVHDDGLDVRLAELDGMKLLAESLQVRFRGEAARKDFPAATRTAQTLFALARHLGEHPTAAGNRLGLAVADLTLDTLEELLGRPGCPNFYWPLTDLPTPLVDIRKGCQGDRAQAAAELRGLKDDEAMTEAELDALVGRLSGRLGLVREREGLPPRGLRPRLAERARDEARVRAARRLLTAERGWRLTDPLMPASQMILIAERRDFEARCDEGEKLVNLPLWQAEALAPDAKATAELLLADLLPRPLDARREQARVEQRIALLRHVEAVRLYATDHRVALPTTLSELTVPLPGDPATGNAFGYAVDGATATLRAAPTRPGAGGLRYEVTVRE